MTQAQRDIRRKLKVIEYAEQLGNISKACRYFGISRESYYRWKKALAEKGEKGLANGSLSFESQVQVHGAAGSIQGAGMHLVESGVQHHPGDLALAEKRHLLLMQKSSEHAQDHFLGLGALVSEAVLEAGEDPPGIEGLVDFFNYGRQVVIKEVQG